ncbi:MAG: glycosyltransferase [Verrucomicrobiia bacterium]|jgi:glycosyltransferase involved in cell wall biosynthesis
MKVAHLIPYLGRGQGGPVFGVAACTAALVGAGCEIEVFSVHREDDGDPIRLDPRVQTTISQRPSWGSFRRCEELWRISQSASFAAIHSHGLWTDVSRLAGALAHGQRLPHILAPCGMLAPKALRYRWWKKLPVRFWFQTRVLKEASCLHAKSEMEFKDIRRFGLRNPVAIIPNPILLPPRNARMSAEEFRRAFCLPAEKGVLLYLGRLHPVKGVPRLIQAWAALREFHAHWSLVLAGPDEQSFRSEFEMAVSKLGCGTSVIFTGELDDFTKWGAYAAARVFVMPSDFENFGNSIVEAMLSGLPVVTTTGTPWNRLPAENAGWCVEPTPAALTEALREAIEMTQDRRRTMGNQAARLANEYHPQRVANDLIQVYRWLLDRGSSPPCVRLD